MEKELSEGASKTMSLVLNICLGLSFLYGVYFLYLFITHDGYSVRQVSTVVVGMMINAGILIAVKMMNSNKPAEDEKPMFRLDQRGDCFLEKRVPLAFLRREILYELYWSKFTTNFPSVKFLAYQEYWKALVYLFLKANQYLTMYIFCHRCNKDIQHLRLAKIQLPTSLNAAHGFSGLYKNSRVLFSKRSYFITFADFSLFRS